jgi:hypothetical protein
VAANAQSRPIFGWSSPAAGGEVTRHAKRGRRRLENLIGRLFHACRLAGIPPSRCEDARQWSVTQRTRRHVTSICPYVTLIPCSLSAHKKHRETRHVIICQNRRSQDRSFPHCQAPLQLVETAGSNGSMDVTAAWESRPHFFRLIP